MMRKRNKHPEGGSMITQWLVEFDYNENDPNAEILCKFLSEMEIIIDLNFGIINMPDNNTQIFLVNILHEKNIQKIKSLDRFRNMVPNISIEPMGFI